jgi:hemoglobin-like flavoprotein
MVTEKQVELVQETWQQVEPVADQAAALFYDRLFELDPMLRPLFPDDLTEQRRKLTAMIDTAVRGLDDLDTVLFTARMLGRRHADYGVQDEDYVTVASALLWTLRRTLGAVFTPEVAQAWTDVYDLLATTMQAAKEAEATLVASASA